MKLSLRLATLVASFLLIFSAHSAVSLAQGDPSMQRPPGEGGGECCYIQTSTPLNERVLVVYNNNVPESLDVANYYASRRGIPATNLLGLNDLSSDS